MKKLFAWRSFVMTFCMVMTVGLWSCNDEDVENGMPFVAVPANQDTLVLEKEGGDSVLEILSNREWTIEVPAAAEEWLSVDPKAGVNNGKVTVTALQNAGSVRTAKLLLSIGIRKTEVLIVQNGEGGSALETPLYQENCGKDVEKDGKYYPYVDKFDGWEKGGSLDQSGVTYSGNKTSVRKHTGDTYSPSSDEFSNFPYVYMGYPDNYFVINGINISGKTNFTFTWAALFQEAYNNAPVFAAVTEQICTIFVSVDGQAWCPLTFKSDNVAGWSKLSAEFKLPEGSEKLYIKLGNNLGKNQQLRLDDFKLFEGGNGTLIEGGSNQPQPGEQQLITIAQLNKQITAEKKPVGNYKVKGVVVTDMENKNHGKGFSIQTEGGKTAGNGILVFNYDLDFTTLGLKVGDEVEIDLSAANLQAYKGKGAQADAPACNELIVANLECIKKTGKTVKIEPVTITADKIADYQSMYVQIDNAQSKDVATVWEGKTYNFAADGKDFPVYVNKSATLVGQTFLTGKGTIKGIAYVYGGSSKANSMAQLVPRNYADVSGLTGGSTGPEQPGEKTYITVADLRAKGEGTLSENLFVKATVISDGNSTSLKNVVVSDGNAGIAIRFTADTNFVVGTELELDLNGAKLSKYYGLLQVNLANAKATTTGTVKKLEAKKVTLADFLAGKCESMYVAIADVEVETADLDKIMVGYDPNDATKRVNTNIGMVAKTGEKFTMFSSKFVAFKDQKVPQGSGELKGIACVNVKNNITTYQIMPQTASDFAGLTGVRF